MPEGEGPPDYGFLCLLVAILQLVVELYSAGHT